MTAWLDHLAANILEVEHRVRTSLRTIARNPAAARQITLNTHQARILLRAAMPAPIATTRMREPHARVTAALAMFNAHLTALNDRMHPPGAAIAAAMDLATELRRWSHVLRWSHACSTAGVRWRLPPVDIRHLVQPQTAEQAFPALDLPSAEAGWMRMEPANQHGRHPPHVLRRLRQTETDDGADIIDIRQLQLRLEEAPSDRTTRTASA